MVKIIHKKYDWNGKLIYSEEIKQTTEAEAKRLLEVIYRSDSFDKYEIEYL